MFGQSLRRTPVPQMEPSQSAGSRRSGLAAERHRPFLKQQQWLQAIPGHHLQVDLPGAAVIEHGPEADKASPRTGR